MKITDLNPLILAVLLYIIPTTKERQVIKVKFKHIYIFVNQNSASSSELLSLGLKKYLNNVTIIGTPTVGKGVGQITFEDKNKKYYFW